MRNDKIGRLKKKLGNNLFAVLSTSRSAFSLTHSNNLECIYQADTFSNT